jgi:hypothetical protein
VYFRLVSVLSFGECTFAWFAAICLIFVEVVGYVWESGMSVFFGGGGRGEGFMVGGSSKGCQKFC